LLRIYLALERRFGPQSWRPGRTPYETAVGALLGRTARTSPVGAIAALRARRPLIPRRVGRLPATRLARAIRTAGADRIGARRVLAFTRWLLARFGGRLAGLRRAPLVPLRRELLGVPDIGPEAADAILLHAAGRPVFVVDAYARRVLARHRLLRRGESYQDVQRFVEAHLPSDPALFSEYHALLVNVGTTHCRAIPLCRGCPLRFDLRGRPPDMGGLDRAPRSPRARSTTAKPWRSAIHRQALSENRRDVSRPPPGRE
jgi:endonuclease-3 related protein